MPLHRLFVPPNFYSDADKEAIADAITKCYPMLPPFYVVVLFIDVEKKNYFVGGEHRVDFVRFSIEHIARQFTNDTEKRVFMDRYEKALEPWTSGRNIDWEIQIQDCDRVLWNMNSLSPPLPDSEGEKLWIKLNKAVPY